MGKQEGKKLTNKERS